MSYSGLGQALVGRGTVTTTVEPNWMGLQILAGIGAASAAAVGMWTRSSRKAAYAAAGTVAAALALSPLIPFGSGGWTQLILIRRGVYTAAPPPAPLGFDVMPRAILGSAPGCGTIGGSVPASCWSCPPGFQSPRDVTTYLTVRPGSPPDWRCIRAPNPASTRPA